MKIFIIKLLILGSIVYLTACSQFLSPSQSNNSIDQQSIVKTPVPAGFYRVQAGDNLYRISLRFKHSMGELSQWNNLTDINQLEVGQVLRVVPPVGTISYIEQTRNRYQPNTTSTKTNQTKPPKIKLLEPTLAPIPLSSLRLKYPVVGQIVAPYMSVLNGIEFSGHYHAPVVASLPGIVITNEYLRGYGNTLIIKRDSDILVVYGFLDKVLVKVNQQVKAGQKIGLVGKNSQGKPALYFELRQRTVGNKSKPIDPTSYFK